MMSARTSGRKRVCYAHSSMTATGSTAYCAARAERHSLTPQYSGPSGDGAGMRLVTVGVSAPTVGGYFEMRSLGVQAVDLGPKK
jgi:hypothetical protein